MIRGDRVSRQIMIQRHKLSLEVPLADVEVPGGQTKQIFRCNKPNALSVTCKSTAPDLLKDGGSRGVPGGVDQCVS